MVLFPAEFSTRANKYIKKLDNITKKRIKLKIDILEEDPLLIKGQEFMIK